MTGFRVQKCTFSGISSVNPLCYFGKDYKREIHTKIRQL